MYNSRFDYSSTHVELSPELSGDILQWSTSNVDDDDIFVSFEDFTYGREDEIHVTILYGIHSEVSTQVKDLLVVEKPIVGTLGRIKVFSNPLKFDVVVIGVRSPDLFRLHNKLAEVVPYTNKYDTYHPHVTVAYVKKGRGWKHHGLSLWSGKKFTCDYVVFSSKNGTKERIILEGRV